jgi:hypothetical protein
MLMVKFNLGFAKTKCFTHQHLPSKEDHLSVDIRCTKKSMLARTIASYIKKNMNSKISVQGAILLGTNGTTTLRKIPPIIRGNDGRGRTLLLQIKTVKGLKREKILPL